MMMYNKNICFKTFQVKSHILILIQDFKGFKEVYTLSDSSYRSQQEVLRDSGTGFGDRPTTQHHDAGEEEPPRGRGPDQLWE